MKDQRGWTLAEHAADDGPSTLKLRRLEPGFDFRAHPERLNLVWKFQDRVATGVASASELQAMERFEALVVERVEAGGKCVLTMVFTELGQREYVFYSRDVAGFITLLNSIPPASDPYPVEIEHESDPSGEFHRSYMESVGALR